MLRSSAPSRVTIHRGHRMCSDVSSASASGAVSGVTADQAEFQQAIANPASADSAKPQAGAQPLEATAVGYIDGRRAGLIFARIKQLGETAPELANARRIASLVELIVPYESGTLRPIGSTLEQGDLVISFYSNLLASSGTLNTGVSLLLNRQAFGCGSASVDLKLVSELAIAKQAVETDSVCDDSEAMLELPAEFSRRREGWLEDNTTDAPVLARASG